jgi:hypothetical protein
MWIPVRGCGIHFRKKRGRRTPDVLPLMRQWGSMTQPRNRTTNRARGGRRSADPPADHDRNELQHDSLVIAHMAVPEFMGRIPHEWHITDFNRFGDLVGKTAESAHLSYLTKFHRKFGMIRIFPVPMLQRVYRILAPQLGWPEIIDAEAPQLSDGQIASREALIAHERVQVHLEAMRDAAQDPSVKTSIGVVLESVEADCQRLRAELGISAHGVAEAATAPTA